jgi:hypothetical protein
MATPPKTKPTSIPRPPGTMDAFAKDIELFFGTSPKKLIDTKTNLVV